MGFDAPVIVPLYMADTCKDCGHGPHWLRTCGASLGTLWARLPVVCGCTG